MIVYELEVDVVRDRDVRPWRVRTHYVTVAVEDRESLTSADLEARNFAAWMCWGIRGSMVTDARIVAVEL